MLVTKVDGPGWAYVFYFVLTQSARSQLADLENASAAVRTLVKFITVDDPAFRERLKVLRMWQQSQLTAHRGPCLIPVNLYAVQH